MKNKKGLILGGFMTDFFVILFVILLILVFLIGSTIVKKVDHSEAGVKIAYEKEIGLKGVDEYIRKDYLNIIELRTKFENKVPGGK